MKGDFLLGSRESFLEPNIYADKSSIVLDWLLSVGIHKKQFSLRDVVKGRQISIGLVQKVFKELVNRGILETEGIRTGKNFLLKKPALLLNSWIDYYNVMKKCRVWNYSSGFKDKAEILEHLKASKLSQKVSFALHSAVEEYGCKNTNLDTLELYMLDPTSKWELETLLRLKPKERGYEVLLIEPYYKSLLALAENGGENVKKSSILLTYLDLYHFPLRGLEQAEFMAQRLPELQNIYRRRKK